MTAPVTFRTLLIGGEYPIFIGDKLCQGRFQILKKLGQGAYGSVWLASDAHDDKFAALKVRFLDLFD